MVQLNKELNPLNILQSTDSLDYTNGFTIGREETSYTHCPL